MMTLAPQLAFNGACRQAFERYAELLDGEITTMNSFGGNENIDLPPGSVAGPPEHIRFAEVRFAGGALRGSDVKSGEYKPMQGFSVSLHLESESDAERIFGALAEGGNVTTALARWSGRSSSAWSKIGLGFLGLFSLSTPSAIKAVITRSP